MRNIGELMKKAQMIQAQMGELQKKMEGEHFEGSAGGGAVSVVFTGKGDPVSVSLNKSVVDPEDVETLEDLLLVAMRDARAKTQEKMDAEMARIQSSLGLPAGMKLPF